MRVLLVFILLLPLMVLAAEEASFPKAGSLLRDEVNVRVGPGTNYPVLWVYKRRGWPVVMELEHQRWYRIRDIEGEVGWVARHLVSSRETALVRGAEPANLYRRVKAEKVVAQLSPGVIVRLEGCTELACKVQAGGKRGWVGQRYLQRVSP